MNTNEEAKPKLQLTKIWKCKNESCKAWVREEFAVADQLCPMCKGPMLRTMKHLPALQKKAKARTK
ncbi:cold-inducible protein YdjO-related protein [Cohnella sp. REN36]|uniref:cold-inducible protein YdjO-related protein n=1 Tax=Cohnella sp. REN36 TaxID=2887347 RepID=UPI001D154339|nr:cold-inducible protein YdjO-related protein [Cohnella sp. REN36]MCC3371690.1 cold-shock protein [Cohnella sp. REN36]